MNVQVLDSLYNDLKMYYYCFQESIYQLEFTTWLCYMCVLYEAAALVGHICFFLSNTRLFYHYLFQYFFLLFLIYLKKNMYFLFGNFLIFAYNRFKITKLKDIMINCIYL